MTIRRPIVFLGRQHSIQPAGGQKIGTESAVCLCVTVCVAALFRYPSLALALCLLPYEYLFRVLHYQKHKPPARAHQEHHLFCLQLCVWRVLFFFMRVMCLEFAGTFALRGTFAFPAVLRTA